MGIQKITINGVSFLGNVSEKDGVSTLKNAMEVSTLSDVSEDTFVDYLAAKNAKALRSKKITGVGFVTDEEDLTPQEALRLEVCTAQMKLTKSNAMAILENEQFRNAMGK